MMSKSTLSLPCVFAALIMFTGCASFNAYYTSPAQCIEGRDYTIVVSITGEVTGVTLYVSLNGGEFKEIDPDKAGTMYQYTVPAKSVKQGKIEYYTIILDKEGKPTQTRTAVVQVLSMAEGKTREEGELARRIKYTGPAEGAITEDLALAWSISPNPYDATLTCYYRFEGTKANTERPLVGQAGRFGFVIQRDDLREGNFLYYLVASETHPDFGDIEIMYPQNGELKPVAINILGIDGLKARLYSEIVKGIRHEAPSEATATEDLTVALAIPVPESVAYGTPAQPPSGDIHIFRLEGRQSEKSYPLELASNNRLTARIDKRDLARGYSAYYFTISVPTGNLGVIELTYPENASRAPFKYTIVTIDELRERKQAELAKLLSHKQPESVTGLEPVTLEVRSSDAKIALRGVLHVRKPASDRYQDIKMTATANGLSAVVSYSMIKDGYTLYYFSVSASYPGIGDVTADVNTEAGPYNLNIKSEASEPGATEVPGEAKTGSGLRAKIEVERIKNTQTNKAYIVSLKIKDAPDSIDATMYFRTKGDSKYSRAVMARRGINFSASIPSSFMKSGKTIEYYFVIASKSPKEEIVYPEKKDAPFSFIVGEKDSDKDKDRDKDRDDDRDKGRDK